MMSRVTTMGMMTIIITEIPKIQDCMKKSPKLQEWTRKLQEWKTNHQTIQLVRGKQNYQWQTMYNPLARGIFGNITRRRFGDQE